MPQQRLKKRTRRPLGQYFLRSKAAVRVAVDAARIAEGERVLEIGPGEGVLTEAILAAGARVIAVEKDVRLANALARKFKGEIDVGQITLVVGDVLVFDPLAYNLKPLAYKIVANIPYYITGAILKHFLSHDIQPSTMVLMVQKEVADRILARNGKESTLSISVKVYGTPRLVKKVPRGSFAPAPTVDSAIIAIENISKRRFEERGISEKAFFDRLRKGFVHKRKFLARNLDVSEDTLKACGIHPRARAEDVSLDQWFCLAG